MNGNTHICVDESSEQERGTSNRKRQDNHHGYIFLPDVNLISLVSPKEKGKCSIPFSLSKHISKPSTWLNT